MADRPLLLMVQVTCAPEHLEPFNLWYNSHLPNLLRTPPFLWAQRYALLGEERRFTALYGIRGVEDLPSMLHWDSPAINPISRDEYTRWERLQGRSNHVGNVYEQIGGTPVREPLLLSDRPLSVVSVDVDPAHEAEWNRWYDDSHVPNLLEVPGYVMAGRFRAIDHPFAREFKTGPRYLALYECESEEAISSLRLGEDMHPDARAEFQRWESYGAPICRNLGWGFYRLISKHFKWLEG